MLLILYHKFVSFSTIQMPTPQSKDRGIGYFHFLLLKLGYSNKTNNPNDSPRRRMFGLFSCGRGEKILNLNARSNAVVMHRLAYPRVPANAARLRSPNREASIKKTKRTGKPFFLFFGRGDKIRTCDFYDPNKYTIVFWLLLLTFWCFLVRKRCFPMLSFALFPRSPKP